MNDPQQIISITHDGFTVKIESQIGFEPDAYASIEILGAALLACGYPIDSICEAMQSFAETRKTKVNQYPDVDPL